MTRFYDAELAKAGVTFSQFALLVRVAACEQGSMADVAGAVGLDPSTLSRTLKPLEAAGWIVIAPDPENRRIRRVRVSEAGAAKMDEAGIQWMAAQKAAQAVFPKQMLAAIAEGAASLSVD
ncbi:MAG: MarR family winged helix-turn-helix transcriptional regulator [Hyphomonadaceae bacterium]